MTVEHPSSNTLETTLDSFLGGRLKILQPKFNAHRSGLDALLLTASLPIGASGDLIDLGAGVGVAGLAALAQNPRLHLTLVDNDASSLTLAQANATKIAGSIHGVVEPRIVRVDVTHTGQERRTAGLVPQCADFVISNPPYNEVGKTRKSPHPDKVKAHVLDDASLTAWFNTAIWLLRAKGQLFAILRTSRLPLVLEIMISKLGGVTVLPIHGRADQAANRVILTGKLGSRAPFRVLPGLVLHGPSGSEFLPNCAALFAGETRLSFD